MAFERDYRALIALAAELGQYQGYADAETKQARRIAENNYNAERNQTAYAILAEKPDLDLVYQRIREDLEVYAEDNPGWDDVCQFVAEDLIARLQQESQKAPAWRMAKRYAAPAILVLLGIAYVGMALRNDLTIDQPIETKAGLLQRAAAYDKARNFESLSGGRGGIIKGILLYPWQPDEAEYAAAADFAGLSLSALQRLTEEGYACNTQSLLVAQEFLDKAQGEFVDGIAAHVQDARTKWEDPPAGTLFAPMAQRFPCPQGAPPPPAAQS